MDNLQLTGTSNAIEGDQVVTTQSIFEELQSETESFPTYKQLLDSVEKAWQKHVGVLPVEIGPKDLVELAVLRQWIQQTADGKIKIAIPKNEEAAKNGSGRSTQTSSTLKLPPAQGLVRETGKVKTVNGITSVNSRSSSARWSGYSTRSRTARTTAKSRTASNQ